MQLLFLSFVIYCLFVECIFTLFTHGWLSDYLIATLYFPFRFFVFQWKSDKRRRGQIKKTMSSENDAKMPLTKFVYSSVNWISIIKFKHCLWSRHAHKFYQFRDLYKWNWGIKHTYTHIHWHEIEPKRYTVTLLACHPSPTHAYWFFFVRFAMSTRVWVFIIGWFCNTHFVCYLLNLPTISFGSKTIAKQHHHHQAVATQNPLKMVTMQTATDCWTGKNQSPSLRGHTNNNFN